MRVTIRRSKTDQEGHGHVIAIPRGVIACPVTALKAWLEASGIAQGSVFRPVAKGGRIQATRLTDRSVADIVKARPITFRILLSNVSASTRVAGGRGDHF